jgi:hypothetical protein
MLSWEIGKYVTFAQRAEADKTVNAALAYVRIRAHTFYANLPIYRINRDFKCSNAIRIAHNKFALIMLHKESLHRDKMLSIGSASQRNGRVLF